MLTEFSLLDLIRVGERPTVEFKESVSSPDKLRRTICAFANDQAEVGGGWLLVGVSDKGNILGAEHPDRVQRALSAASRDGMNPPITCDIEVVEVSGKLVVACHVERSSIRPHCASGVCWVRVGSEARAATPEEVRKLFERHQQAGATEDQAVPAASTADIDWDRFAGFLRAREGSGLLDDRPLEEVAMGAGWLLKRAGVLGPSLAMMLLFGRDPDRFLPWSSIDFARFAGMDRAARVEDRQIFKGNLVDSVRRCLQKVSDLSLKAYEFSSARPERTDLQEYPALVVREALANAVVHRDYAHRTATVTVWMFDDRIEVQSPGGLFGRVTAQNFGRTTDYRNRRIAEGFYHMARLTEMLGRGVPFMRREMTNNGSPEPRFEFDPGYVAVALPAQPIYQARRLYIEGTALLADGHAEAAVRVLGKSAELADRFAEVHVALASALRKQGRIDEAEASLRTALEVGPDHPPAWIELASIYSLDRDDPQRARVTYRAGARSCSRPAEILRQAARLEQREKRHRQAFELLREAVRSSPDDWTLMQELGALAIQLGYTHDALDALERAARLAGEDASAGLWYGLLRARARTGADKEAVYEAYRRTVALQPRMNSAYQETYDYAQRKGDINTALDIVEAAREQGFELRVEQRDAPCLDLFIPRLPAETTDAEFRAWLEELGFNARNITVWQPRASNTKVATMSIEGSDLGQIAAKIKEARFRGNQLDVRRQRPQLRGRGSGRTSGRARS